MKIKTIHNIRIDLDSDDKYRCRPTGMGGLTLEEFDGLEEAEDFCRETLDYAPNLAKQFFRRNVCEYLEGIRANKTGDDYFLNTLAGVFRITPHGGWIACRFDDVERAGYFLYKHKLQTCTVEGQWDWHYNNRDYTNGLIIGKFVKAIERLLEGTAEEMIALAYVGTALISTRSIEPQVVCDQLAKRMGCRPGQILLVKKSDIIGWWEYGVDYL